LRAGLSGHIDSEPGNTKRAAGLPARYDGRAVLPSSYELAIG